MACRGGLGVLVGFVTKDFGPDSQRSRRKPRFDQENREAQGNGDHRADEQQGYGRAHLKPRQRRREQQDDDEADQNRRKH